MKSIIGTCLNVKKPQNRTILVISRSWEFKSSTTTSDYGQLKESLKKIEVPRNENHQDKKKDSESSEGGSSSDFRLGSNGLSLCNVKSDGLGLVQICVI